MDKKEYKEDDCNKENDNGNGNKSNKNKFLKWFFGFLGCILFVLALVLFFTLALSLAVKIIISLAFLIFSVVCFVIVYKIRRLELPQNLNNDNLAGSEQPFSKDKQKDNEKEGNRTSSKINQEDKTGEDKTGDDNLLQQK